MTSEEQCQLLITDTFFQFSLQTGIISILLAITFSFYIYYKCPYIVRITGTLCIVSWLSQLLDLENKNVYNDEHEINTFPFISFLSCLTSALQQNLVFLHSAFIAALFIRLWWCNKLNLIRDATSLGFDHLQEWAGNDGKTKNEKVKEYLQMRDNGTYISAFPNGWIPILESRSLNVGQAKSVFKLGQMLAVFRDQKGKAHVLDAYCPHSGANLAVDGKVVGNCLECHKWRFSGEDGSCTHVAYSKKVPTVAKTKCWACKEINGFIYIWHHTENLPPSWNLFAVPEISDGPFSYRGKTEHTVFCHIMAAAENGSDLSHFDSVHSSNVFFSGNSNSLLGNGITIKHEFKNLIYEPCTEPDRKHIAKLSVTQCLQIFNFQLSLTEATFTIEEVGPSTYHIRMNTFLGKAFMLATFMPEEILQFKTVSHLYTGFLYPQWSANLLLEGYATMLERDIVIWNNMKILKNPIFVKEDKTISIFRRWYSQFYSKGSECENDVRKNGLTTLRW